MTGSPIPRSDDFGEDVDAVHVRHVEVEDDKIDRLRLNESGDRRAAIER